MGPRAPLINLLEIAKEQRASERGRRVEPIDVDVRAAEIRAEAHDVALISDHVMWTSRDSASSAVYRGRTVAVPCPPSTTTQSLSGHI
jgi:hypothetical protein